METRTPSLGIDDEGNNDRVKGVRWFINLEFETRKTDLVL